MFTFAYFLNDDGDDGFDKRQMGARHKCELDRLGYSWACSLSAGRPTQSSRYKFQTMRFVKRSCPARTDWDQNKSISLSADGTTIGAQRGSGACVRTQESCCRSSFHRHQKFRTNVRAHIGSGACECVRAHIDMRATVRADTGRLRLLDMESVAWG